MGVSPEEAAAECPFINEYCRTKHRSLVKCSWTPEKGRILLSQAAFKHGDVIFREPPLHIVAEQKGNKAFDRLKELCAQKPQVFEYEPLWYWTALNSLMATQLPPSESRLMAITEDQQRKLFCLYHSEVTEPTTAVKLLVMDLGLEATLDPLSLERLLQIWILNCFEHSDSPLGYSTYFMSSFMSHSCQPNAVWHYDKDDFVLRARSDIAAKDEICVSYLSEDALLESVIARRKHLKDSKHFVCTCVRCIAERDSSRGFRCPKCAAPAFYVCKADIKGASELTGSTCDNCGHGLTAAEASDLVGEEKWLEQKLEGCERRMEKNSRSKHSALLTPLEEAVERSGRTLSQHWLHDKAWQMLADVYERNDRREAAEELLRKRISFQQGAYPGLSGTRAWTSEAYADMLLRHSGATVDPHVKVPSQGAAEQLAKSAHPVYQEALRILRLMFGEEHEYYTSVNRKARELELEIQRFSKS
mmetsp:Transcript_54089/g.118429  ORF Transcript_54089/g.118429 Transcript_54089/m.118429 type:complete len:474 (-) Transcript_54089:102-1523(-)